MRINYIPEQSCVIQSNISVQKMDRIISGVYQIRNILSDRVYIGSSTNIESRLRKHFKELRSKTHGNYKLQADFDKFGEAIFETSVLEEFSSPVRAYLYDLEQVWMNKFKGKYNINNNAKAHLKKEDRDIPLNVPRKKPKSKNKSRRNWMRPPKPQEPIKAPRFKSKSREIKNPSVAAEEIIAKKKHIIDSKKQPYKPNQPSLLRA